MKMSLVEAKDAFLYKIGGCYLKVGHKLGLSWQPIRISFDLKGVNGGTAYGPMNLIKINPSFVDEDHYEDLLHQTIPHEYAHILVYRKYGSTKGHGAEWKYVMRLLGCEPRRCHDYDISKAVRTIEYRCPCQVHQYTTRRHAKVVKYGYTYTCRLCKGRIVRGSL